MIKTSTLTNVQDINSVESKLETISNLSSRSEKTSWNRKMDNLVKLLAKLQPIENKILDIIQNEKMPIQDEIHQLRQTMVNECIHPSEYLVVEDDGGIKCKFCDRRISVIDHE